MNESPHTVDSLKYRSTLPVDRKKVYKAINWFHDTPKTESAFYLRFQTMSAEEKAILSDFWHVKESFDLFSHLCKWWAVKQA
ncbi:MAG: hypothetical protein JXM79_01520 [Sedimentisphaerales bacterium]|nr:hypothetical protein [Sedimentisphaerales bacterium]